MNRSEIALNKVPVEIVTTDWIENESIVKAVFYFENAQLSNEPWVGLKAPTLDGNELWIVKRTKVSQLEAKMGFKKPLTKYFDVSPEQANLILGTLS